MIQRRIVLAGLGALSLGAARRRFETGRMLLNRAVEAAGGQAALARVGTLAWTGTAKIFAGERTIEIGVSTRVVPFVSARSDSWLLADGPAKTNSLIIEGEQGWIERHGARTPMPPAMLAHERDQYALYGLMLLVPSLGPGGNVQSLPNDCLVALHHGAPPTQFCFDADAKLKSAQNTVPDPETGARVEQRFVFEGAMASNGVRWPRKLTIEQNGKPYFELTLATFEAVPR